MARPLLVWAHSPPIQRQCTDCFFCQQLSLLVVGWQLRSMCGFRQKFGLVNSNHFWSIVAEFEWYMELYEINFWPHIYSLCPYLQFMPADDFSSSWFSPHRLSIVSRDVHSATIQFRDNADCQLKQLCLWVLCVLYTLSQNDRFYSVTSYLTEKLSKLRSFDRQYRRPQNCPFQSSFTQRTEQFTQGIPQFPQFTCRHHDGIISRHIRPREG